MGMVTRLLSIFALITVYLTIYQRKEESYQEPMTNQNIGYVKYNGALNKLYLSCYISSGLIFNILLSLCFHK